MENENNNEDLKENIQEEEIDERIQSQDQIPNGSNMFKNEPSCFNPR